MKKYLALILAMTLIFASPLLAASKDSTDNGYLGNDDWIVQNDGDLIPTGTSDIGSSSDPVSAIYVGSATINGSGVKVQGKSVGEFIVLDDTIAIPSATTLPGLESDNNITSLVWADGETTKAQVAFRVPDDYLSGGAFRLLCDDSGATTVLAAVDFEVYVNTDGGTWDAAASSQPAVTLTEASGSPEQVTLTVGTDFSALASGSYINLNIWRDDVNASTNDLEVYYAEFYYTATTE